MTESKISDIGIVKTKDEYTINDSIEVNVSFKVEGGLRDAFNEANWTKAYNSNDVSLR